MSESSSGLGRPMTTAKERTKRQPALRPTPCWPRPPPTSRRPSPKVPTATRSVREDATAGDFVGAPVVATDPDTDDSLDYLLIGPWAGFFTTELTNGQIFLRNGAYLDYEGTESYTVNLRVRDNKDADGADDILWDAFIDVTINVIDVDEPGEIEFDSDHPQVSTKFAAHLDDEDLPISNLSWPWQSADTADATDWVDVDGATTADYTPVFADHGEVPARSGNLRRQTRPPAKPFTGHRPTRSRSGWRIGLPNSTKGRRPPGP